MRGASFRSADFTISCVVALQAGNVFGDSAGLKSALHANSSSSVCNPDFPRAIVRRQFSANDAIAFSIRLLSLEKFLQGLLLPKGHRANCKAQRGCLHNIPTA